MDTFQTKAIDMGRYFWTIQKGLKCNHSPSLGRLRQKDLTYKEKEHYIMLDTEIGVTGL